MSGNKHDLTHMNNTQEITTHDLNWLLGETYVQKYQTAQTGHSSPTNYVNCSGTGYLYWLVYERVSLKWTEQADLKSPLL